MSSFYWFYFSNSFSFRSLIFSHIPKGGYFPVPDSLSFMLLPRRTVAGFFTRSVVKVPRCLWIARIFVFVSLYNGRVSGALRYVEVCQFFPLYIGSQNNGFSRYNPSRKVMHLCLCMITYCLCTQQTVCLSLSKATFRSPLFGIFFLSASFQFSEVCF